MDQGRNDGATAHNVLALFLQQWRCCYSDGIGVQQWRCSSQHYCYSAGAKVMARRHWCYNDGATALLLWRWCYGDGTVAMAL